MTENKAVSVWIRHGYSLVTIEYTPRHCPPTRGRIELPKHETEIRNIENRPRERHIAGPGGIRQGAPQTRPVGQQFEVRRLLPG